MNPRFFKNIIIEIKSHNDLVLLLYLLYFSHKNLIFCYQYNFYPFYFYYLRLLYLLDFIRKKSEILMFNICPEIIIRAKDLKLFNNLMMQVSCELKQLLFSQ
jgi:hypothetical protein